MCIDNIIHSVNVIDKTLKIDMFDWTIQQRTAIICSEVWKVEFRLQKETKKSYRRYKKTYVEVCEFKYT